MDFLKKLKNNTRDKSIDIVFDSGLTLLIGFLSAAVIVGVSLEVAFDYIKVR
jgi:hypothetical protein